MKPGVAPAAPTTTGGGRLRAAAASGVLTAGAALLLAAPGAASEALAASGPAPPAPTRVLSQATPAIADSPHYPANALDVRPGIKVRVNPGYPARAARENVSGKAVVRLYIDVNGAVERVEIEGAAPAGYGFDDAAASAFRSARFSPAMKDGKRVRAQMRIEVSFDAPTAQPKR